MKTRILLVEDDEFVSALVQTILRNAGYSLVAVSSLDEARALLEFEFDALITDFQLPDADGCSVIAHARLRCPGISVILASGHGGAMKDLLADRGLEDVHLLEKLSVWKTFLSAWQRYCPHTSAALNCQRSVKVYQGGRFKVYHL